MKALKFNQTGSLDQLKMVDVPDPIPAAGEVLVRVQAAAINPSDIKNVLGKMQETKPPRIPGRDFAGIVVSDSKWKGKSVFGTGGLLGFSKDGTHAELVAVSENTLVELPHNISFAKATAMGLSYVAAWQSVVVVGKLKSKETILITGAAGAVGGAALRIAISLGAKVFGTYVSSNNLPNDLLEQVTWINLDKEKLPDKILELTNNRGVDLVFDVIGGKLFEPCLKCLALHGRQIAIASSDPIVSFNLIDFYHIEKGFFVSQEIDEIPLSEAINAYEEINSRKAKNKKVIVF
jgi:NADPH:quinone reductase